MAATNRPEVLDRPCFARDASTASDRGQADVRGREAILHVHRAQRHPGARVYLHVLAARTPGMAGADLANSSTRRRSCRAQGKCRDRPTSTRPSTA